MLTPPIFGAIKGNGNFSLYLDLVPSNAPLHTQDVVVTSGQEGIFPRNLLIGSITQSTKNDLKPFQTAPIQPFFDVKNHDTLFIITDYKREK
jgi:rod shape-determining protein MreC